MCDDTIKPSAMSPQAFAALGASRVAYVRSVRSDEVAFRYPGAPQLAPGAQVFVLHAADGTPIVLADSRESAAEGAASHQLETVSVH